MSRINVHCDLQYTVTALTTFSFAVFAAHSAHQQVLEERSIITPEPAASRGPARTVGPRPRPPHRRARPVVADLRRDGRAVGVRPSRGADGRDVVRRSADRRVTYLNPSRYCQSDLLNRLAMRTFGDIPAGFERVTGICNWVYDRME